MKNFDFDYENEYDDEFEITVSLVIISKIICRRCKSIMTFNNALHKHFKVCVEQVAILKNVATISNANKNISIRILNVDVNKNIDTEYTFREYHYAFANVFLIEHEFFISVYANTETEIILIDTIFFNATVKNVSIKTMTISITVRDLSISKHSTDKYVIVSMFFSEKKQR